MFWRRAHLPGKARAKGDAARDSPKVGGRVDDDLVDAGLQNTVACHAWLQQSPFAVLPVKSISLTWPSGKHLRRIVAGSVRHERNHVGIEACFGEHLAGDA
jgi:hypothetical protein